MDLTRFGNKLFNCNRLLLLDALCSWEIMMYLIMSFYANNHTIYPSDFLSLCSANCLLWVPTWWFFTSIDFYPTRFLLTIDWRITLISRLLTSKSLFYMKSFIVKRVISILANLRYLRFQLLKYKENNKKICDTFDHNFKNIPLYIMS